MSKPRQMRAWRHYLVSVEFGASLAYAYRWCTDYTTQDGKYAGEDKSIHLERRIIDRSRRRVVFENLYDAGKGWAWERHVVTLHPPRRWHSEGQGNLQESVLDYSLFPISDRRTRLQIRWKSRPIGRGPRPSQQQIERHVTQLWKRRARFLQREYRRSLSTSG